MRSKLAVSVIGAALVAALVAALASPSVASAPAPASSARSAQDVNLQISLKGRHAFAHAVGGSQYQSQSGQSEFQAEVEHVRALAGKQLLFKVNGAMVGRMTVSKRGQADLTVNSELGQKVPSISSGTLVTITTGSGTMVVSGRY